jgi:phosphatidylglycerophosphate synthase
MKSPNYHEDLMDRLKDEKYALAYLNACLQDGDGRVFLQALRHVAEAHGINFAAVRLGKIKMFVQIFAIGTVLIKVAHVPAAWGHWFTLIVFTIMVAITVASGLQATWRIRTARS